MLWQVNGIIVGSGYTTSGNRRQTMKSTSRASGDRVDCDNDMGDTILFEQVVISCLDEGDINTTNLKFSRWFFR